MKIGLDTILEIAEIVSDPIFSLFLRILVFSYSRDDTLFLAFERAFLYPSNAVDDESFWIH